MDKQLKKIHEVEVEILDKIVEICNKYNIKYFFIGGTLLGAVRHKGFIPWDDDIDLGMLREDYEKFIDVCINKNALGSKYFLHCNESDENYFIPFIKVKKNNTTFEEKSLEGIETHKGIFVDIFPYDNVPKQKSFIQKLQAIIVRSIHDTIYVKYNVYKLKTRRRKILVLFFRLFNIKFLKKIEKKVSIKYNNKNTDYITCLPATYSYEKETVLKNKIFPLKKIEFEGKKYFGMNDNDYFLTQQFGDYMKLPPNEQRKTHMPTYISFTKGESRINEN